MHDIQLFTTWVGLSIICPCPAEDVRQRERERERERERKKERERERERERESISSPEVLVISFFHQLEQRALKSHVTMEHIGNS